MEVRNVQQETEFCEKTGLLEGERKLYKNMASSPHPPTLSFDSSVSFCKVFKKKSNWRVHRTQGVEKTHYFFILYLFNFGARSWPIWILWFHCKIVRRNLFYRLVLQISLNYVHRSSSFYWKVKWTITLLTHCTLTFGQSHNRTGLFTQWISVGY